MSISDKLSRLLSAKEEIAEAILSKGGTVSTTDGFEEYPDDIRSIPKGESDLKYVQITAVEDNSTVVLAWVRTTSDGYNNFQYKISTDGTTWTDYVVGTSIVLSHTGDFVRFIGIDNWRFYDSAARHRYQFQITGKVSVSGDLIALYCNSPFGFFAVESNLFYELFKNCVSLTDASGLIIRDGEVNSNVSNQVFKNMFYGCTSLVRPPKIYLTTVGTGFYEGMFYGCTSLVEAPELPATTLASKCYQNMFYGCTSLAEAPELPATALSNGCYQNMFYGCTSLVEPPELPATTLGADCYYGMFGGCTALRTAPELPATTLAVGCYYYMFWKCESLSEAPELPATTLAQDCYRSMFYGCESLTAAPELPALEAKKQCYYGMFEACTNLISGAVMHFVTASTLCCGYMYSQCTSLSSIKLDWIENITSYFTNWVSGVPEDGTFYYNGGDTTRGISAIPTGWTITPFSDAA